MITPAQINNFITSLTWQAPAFPGLAVPQSISASAKVTSITNVLYGQGTYTPNNDYIYLFQNLPQAQCPNFLIVLCSGQLNLTSIGNTGNPFEALPVTKQFIFFLPQGTAYQINALYLEGRTANVVAPMSQGTPVDYFYIAGQATIA